MSGRSSMDTVTNGNPSRKDLDMKLYIVFSTLLAISLAKDIESKHALEDVEAENLAAEELGSNLELFRTSREDKETLDTAAATYNSNYVPPSQRPPRPWDNVPAQNQNYIPNTPVNVPQNTNYRPTPISPPQNNYIPSQNQNYIPSTPVQDYQPNVPAHEGSSNYFPSTPQNNIPQYNPPQNTKPQNTYPQNNFPQNNIPQNDVQTNPQAPQNDWYYPAVIKNEQYFGENGNYNYEYQIADGTHVSEQGWLTNPNTDKESVVKKGWYSYTGADGKVYTVTWWADDSGFHAFGDHLPTPPPVPAAVQAGIDQAAKEEAEKNKPVYYPVTQAPTYHPTTQAPYYPPVTQKPTYYPQQPTYYPQQPTYYPQQTYPQQQYPQQPIGQPGK